MAYDEKAAERIRQALKAYKAVAEIKMFGGLCFTLRGRMCMGVLKRDLVVRVPAERYAELLDEPQARPMDFTGRPMKGFLFVSPKGYATPASLRRWVRIAADFAMTLPPKA